MGYGEWPLILNEIQQCRDFEFDWFFRTLSASDIQKRCDALIDAIRSKESELEKTKSKQDGKSSSVL